MDPRENPINTIPDNIPLSEVDMNDVILDLGEAKKGLKTLKDELELKLHLAEMDSRDLRADIVDSVEDLKERLELQENQLKEKLDKIGLQSHLGLQEAKKRWDITRHAAEQALAAFRKDKGKAMSVLQEINLKGHLAKLEAEDLVEQTQETFRESARSFKSNVKEFIDKLKAH